MALKTTLEQLEEVQSAITAVMLSQSYTIAGQAITRANLPALQAREEKLLDRYKKETGQGVAVVNIGTMRRD